MSKPRILDLFCGAGGAAMGYHRAGFDVVGVDIDPQPDYPYEFHQADVMVQFDDGIYEAGFGPFDAIHASPPCQGYVQFNNLNAERYGNRVEHPLLIGPVRQLLVASRLPWVMENVVGSTIQTSVMLCGSSFGLGVVRHRVFESNVLLMGPPTCQHTGTEIAVYGKLDGRRIWTRSDGSEVRCASTLKQAQRAMDIDWMDWEHLKEAIPPAYAEWIGGHLINALEVAA